MILRSAAERQKVNSCRADEVFTEDGSWLSCSWPTGTSTGFSRKPQLGSTHAKFAASSVLPVPR